MLGGLYLLMAIMLVLGALDGAARAARPSWRPWRLAWVAIFGAGFVLFTFRDDLGWVAQRLRAEATGDTGQRRRRTSAFRWRSTAISGSTARSTATTVKFLVDSGATMTTIGRDTAGQRRRRRRAGPRPDGPHRQRHRARRQRAAPTAWRSGRSSAATCRLHVADDDDLNVLGMNFLSSLQRWGVEGRWLVLQP